MFTPLAYEMHLQIPSATPHTYFMEFSKDKHEVLYLRWANPLDRLALTTQGAGLWNGAGGQGKEQPKHEPAVSPGSMEGQEYPGEYLQVKLLLISHIHL